MIDLVQAVQAYSYANTLLQATTMKNYQGLIVVQREFFFFYRMAAGCKPCNSAQEPCFRNSGKALLFRSDCKTAVPKALTVA